jgi:hypothetical protein
LDELATMRKREELRNTDVTCDGIVPAALVVGLQGSHRAEWLREDQRGPGHLAEAEASAARIVAGSLIDATRTVEMQRATALAAHSDLAGVSVGSMRSQGKEVTSWLKCEACGELVARRWHVKPEPSNEYTSALADRVCIRQMAVEPATAGKDIDATLAESGKAKEAPPATSDDARPAFRAPVPRIPTGRRLTRGSMLFVQQALADAEPPVEPPPWAVTGPYLHKARKAARAERHRTGVEVCFSCACGPPHEKAKQIEEPRLDRERAAFSTWARLSPTESKALRD